MTARRFLFTLGCLSTVAACTLFNSLDEYGPGQGRADASTDGPGTTPGTDADTCQHARPPGRPAKNGSADSARLVFAIDALYVGLPPNPGNATVGYDLDNVCTCPGPASCNAAPKKTNTANNCDGENGVDNSGAELIQTITLAAGSDGNPNAAISEGRSGLLIQLAGYNGTPDDDDLQLTFFATSGTELDGEGKRIPPVHDGNDSWTVRRDSLFGGNGDGPNYIGANRDDHAYVANGTLVAHVDFPLSFGNIDAILKETVITARIEGTGASTKLLDGRFVGRWRSSDLLTALDSVPDPLVPGGGVCGSSALYQQLKGEICAAVDLRGTASEDSQQPLLNCDALGMVMSFTAGTAKLGTPSDRTPPVHFCGAGYTDSCPAF